MMESIIRADGWLGVELRHFAALEAVAREGSFGRAADVLGYTQSAVSQQIATLERIVGERLVERPGGPRRISLTDAGEVLLRHAKAITARLDAAHADVAALRDGDTGTLSVGIYQSVGAHVLPRLMHRFIADWPGVHLNLVEVNADSESDVVSRVERGELDLAFWVLPLPESQLTSVELLRDEFVLAVPASSPFAGRSTVSLDDLGDTALIGHRRCKTNAQAEAALRESGVEPRVAFRSDDNVTVQNLVGAGLGVALVPRLTLDESDSRVRVVELDPPLPARRIALCWHRDRHRSPAARAFVDLSVAVCNELAGIPAAA
jgi:molybdate transport repressor ModE-like protein